MGPQSKAASESKAASQAKAASESEAEWADAELVRAVREGGSDAFATLFARHRLMVVSFAYSRIRDRHDAEVIAQDAFVRAYRSLHTLAEPNRFSSWLLRITDNLCRDWYSGASRRPRPADPALLVARESERDGNAAPPASRAAEERELGERIHRAIEALREPYRTTATLRYLGGKTCQTIADELGLGVGTITMRLSRANRELRQALASEDERSEAPGMRGETEAREGRKE